MNWGTFITAVQERTGLPKSTVKRVLDAMVQVAFEAIDSGDSVLFKDLFTLRRQWRDGRTLRSIADGHRLFMDGRYVVRLRPSRKLRDALVGQTPQYWRQPEHQEAWRVAATLVGDLDLYHRARAPRHLSTDLTSAEVDEACADAFGPLWARVRSTYESRVSEDIRAQRAHLVLAAVERWAALEPES